MENWRNYFESSNSNIFDIIKNAIRVAASDYPTEFRSNRDKIAELLFSCKLSRCLGCDQIQLAEAAEDENGGSMSGVRIETKVNSSGAEDESRELKTNNNSNYSYREAEALTDEIEEANHNFEEVLRIKGILDHSCDEADSVIFDSLRRLQLMELSIDILEATKIGKSVNALRKHGNEQIKGLARNLYDGWKVMVDEFVKVSAPIQMAVEGTTPDSVNPSVVDEEEGLPSPPLDEGYFFATQPTSMELDQFFDGLDDEGNPRNSGEFNKNRENERKPPKSSQNVCKPKHQPSNEVANVRPKDYRAREVKKQEANVKPNKPLSTESGPGRPDKPSVEKKANNEMKFSPKSDKVGIQRRPVASQQDKIKCSDEAARAKLEAAKRRLQEGYEEAKNAKKQRTIQMMELQDLPKQGLGHKNPHIRGSGSSNRPRPNVRR